jgi:hypothetical protein
MMEAAIRAIAQLRDRALLGVLAISGAGAAIFLLGVWFGLAAVLGHVTVFGTGWLDWLARIAIGRSNGDIIPAFRRPGGKAAPSR